MVTGTIAATLFVSAGFCTERASGLLRPEVFTEEQKIALVSAHETGQDVEVAGSACPSEEQLQLQSFTARLGSYATNTTRIEAVQAIHSLSENGAKIGEVICNVAADGDSLVYSPIPN